jgi:ribonuclease P/MRP protein subunit POP1
VQGPSKDGTAVNANDDDKKTSEQEAGGIDPPFNIRTVRYTPGDTNKILNSLSKAPVDSSSLATIHLTLPSRGTPTPCARIYRLPTDPALRCKWLELASTRGKSGEKSTSLNDPTLSQEEARRRLAESLISTSAHENSTSDHLEVPTEEDLIGFVTTGNFNLSEGKGTGIGSIQLSKVLVPDVKPSERRMCIVRSAGEKLGRLGVWELV